MNKRLQIAKYVVADLLMASLAWAVFYIYRKKFIEPQLIGIDHVLEFDQNFYLGILVVPFFWVITYALIGMYNDIYRKSRLKELGQTLLTSVVGALIIFFALLLDDMIPSYKTYYQSFLTLFSLHFLLTAIARFTITTNTGNKIKSGKIGFPSIIIGSNEKALKLYNEFIKQPVSEGYMFVGFVNVVEKDDYLLEARLPHLGHISNVRNIIRDHKIEEVIIALESSEHLSIGRIINELEDLDIIVKVIPDMYDILSGSVRMNAIFGQPLIQISSKLMPVWQQSFKRIFDILVSAFFLIFLSPVFLTMAIVIKLESKGPIFFKQERIGLHGNPFFIYKFRSMHVNAENGKPMLSSKDDKRVTRIGKIIRSIRLDEIPQFYNVLKGEMSLVGPRPERQYYIDQIMDHAPHYRHLHKVRPGITSWGQVKFGYAENVEQMLERLKYDIIYIENMSLALDFKILFYTVRTILKGSGK